MDPVAASPEFGPEVALVQLAQEGDRAAFDQLARHYRASLLALAFLRTSDMEAAEDLVQEVLTRAWQKLPTLQDPAAFLPWLKTIIANACRSWHRRARPATVSLDEPVSLQVRAETDRQPLELLLARERQRLLRQALVALPEANRMALLLHVWGDYSYKEIARFTGVQVTTVEGRIHRARRQLQHLLQQEGLLLLGARNRVLEERVDFTALVTTASRESPGSARVPDRQLAVTPRPERKLMSHEPSHPLSQPLALVLFSHQFATLLNCGVSVPHALDVLQEAPAPYGEAARDLRPEVERGIALSQAMATQPTLFSPFYRGMVRAGEVGDMLEDTLRRVADLITKEWKLAPGCPGQGEQVSLLLSGSQPVPGDWGELSPYQQTVLLLLFCETFGLLLVSGVPILQSMEIVAELLSPKEREGLLAAREEVKVGQSLIPGLERLGILPRVAIELITVGFEGGNLDVTLERAAGIFQHELECRLIGSPR